jgi:hypothetical protein
MEKVEKVQQAVGHRPFRPDSLEYQNFLKTQAEKVSQLMEKHPFLDLTEEFEYFKRKLEG